MCGIAGFFKPGSGAAWMADQIMAEAVLSNQLRGRDAVGMFGQLKGESHIEWLKMVGPADEWHKWDQPHKRFYKTAEKFRFIVAHNRAATVGAADSKEAAHPHKTEHITLVHNGTLNMSSKEKEDFISDSAMVAHMMEQETDFSKIEEQLNGPYAFVWHDSRDDTLNFVRNAGRPLGFIEQGNGTVWFASEPKMMEWLLTRRNQTVVKVTPLDEFTHVKLMPDGSLRETKVETPTTVYYREKSEIVESFYDTEEGKLTLERIMQGNVRDWDHTSVVCGPTAPVKLLPASISRSIHRRGGASTAPATFVDTDRREKEVQVMRDGWCSMNKGTKVYFYPLTIQPSVLPKQQHRTQLYGPLLLWNDQGDVEFVGGVEVRGRLLEEIDGKEGDTIEQTNNRIAAMYKSELIHEGVIANITKDLKRKKVTLWIKDSTPQDWWSFEDFNVKPAQARAAAAQEYDMATLEEPASEVAGSEKK